MDVLELLDGIRVDKLPGWANKEPEPLRKIRIFLASSAELREDRDEFELYFRQQNDQFRKHGFYLKIVRWENFLDAMSETRLQDEYNKAIRACDIFVCLFFTKTGKFTEEEFDVAHRQFKETGKPRIYTFFKNADIKTGSAPEEDLTSLWAFQKKLKKLGHFHTNYDNIEHLKRQFRDQLDKIPGRVRLSRAVCDTVMPRGDLPVRLRGGGLWVLVFASVLRLSSQPAGGNVTLEGEVVNAVTGEPLAGARVKVNVSRGREPLYLKTDADGRFLSQDLPAGYYSLDVNSPGFSSGSSLSLDVRTTGTATFALVRAAGAKLSRYLDKNGVLHAEVFLPLTPYAVITGRVATDPEGFPVEDCWVEVLRRRSASREEIVPVTMLHTDDKGEFRGSHLGPGTYYVAANRPGPWSEWESSFRITYYPRALDVASAKPLELAAGQQARADIQILRRAGVRVAGHLLLPGGEAGANRRLMTKVFLRPEQSNLINSNGPFTTRHEQL